MMERYEYLAAAEERLYAAVPPLDPPPLHWLTSDAGNSYCYPCARKAVMAEKGVAAWPDKSNVFSWQRTPEQEAAAELEEELEDGIDGGFDTHSDHTEACETCGCTLSYLLTDYGVQEELAHYAEQPGFEVVGPEQTYEVSRICLNLTWEGAPADQVEAAIVIVDAALEAVAAGRVSA